MQATQIKEFRALPTALNAMKISHQKYDGVSFYFQYDAPNSYIKTYSVEKNKLFFNNNTFTLHTLQHFADMLSAVRIQATKRGEF